MRAFAMRSVAAAIGGSLTVALVATSVAYADDTVLAPVEPTVEATQAPETTIPGATTPAPTPEVTSAPSPTPAPSTTTAPKPPVLKLGSTGSKVYRLERRIKVESPNKTYGWPTVERVKQIQTWGGLDRNGRVGPATAKVIDKYVAAKRAEWLKAKAEAKKRAASVSGRLAAIISAAKRYDGGRYVRGGRTPSGFDCSGYTSYVVRKAIGKSLPHQSGAQRSSVKRISRSAAKPGDLIFFHGGGGGVYHVGIYAGGGKLYHSSRPGTRVGLGPIFSSNVSFGRVV
jgi:cell wall-associated NlpC family hydrolase